jgi:hypothetical protein
MYQSSSRHTTHYAVVALTAVTMKVVRLARKANGQDVKVNGIDRRGKVGLTGEVRGKVDWPGEVNWRNQRVK